MNIYLLEQSENLGYNTFDSMIVIAKNPIEAKLIHPEQAEYYTQEEIQKEWDAKWSPWASCPENVTAILIGKQDKRYIPESPILCSSFNAG